MSALAALVFGLATLSLSGGDAAANAIAANGYSSLYSGESTFMSMPAGSSGQFSAIFFNDGSQPWQPGIVGLLVCLPDKVTCNVPSPNAAYASNWYSPTVYATVTAPVPPGSNGFFIFNFKVPANALPASTATFNGEVGLIGAGAVLRPEGYYQSNTTPLPTSPLSITPTSATVAVGGQLQFTSSIPSAWTVVGGCGAITGTGLFAAIAVNAPSQPCTVVASSAGMVAQASVSVFGVPTSLACTSSKPTIAADGLSTATVSATLRDANGNQVANASTPAITFTNVTPTLDSIFPSGPQTPTAGVVTITLTASTIAGSIQVTATAPSLTGCNIIIPSVASGSASQLAASFLTNPVAADGTTNSVLRVDLLDANGNRAVGDFITTVYATRAPSSSGICSIGGIGSVGATVSQGRVDLAVTVTTQPGICAFSVTANTLSVASAQAALTTVLVGAANRLSVVGTDSPKIASGTSTLSITVDVQDAHGQRVTSSAALITIGFDVATCTGAPGGNVFAPSGSALSALQGRATFQLTSFGAYPACAVTANAPGLTGTNAAVRFDPGPPDHLSCAFVPTAIRNDGLAVAAASVRVLDSHNNSVTTTGPYSVTFLRNTGSSTTILTGSPVMTVNGVATFYVRSTQSVGLDAYNATITIGTLPTLVNAATLTACLISVQTIVP